MEYRLIRDYRAAHTFLRVTGTEDRPLAWPSIGAWDDGELVGLLGRIPDKRAVVVGPLVAPGRPRVAWRLLHVMERVLWAAGVTIYLWGVDRDKASWLSQLRRSGIAEEVGITDNQVIFKREMVSG